LLPLGDDASVAVGWFAMSTIFLDDDRNMPRTDRRRRLLFLVFSIEKRTEASFREQTQQRGQRDILFRPYRRFFLGYFRS